MIWVKSKKPTEVKPWTFQTTPSGGYTHIHFDPRSSCGAAISCGPNGSAHRYVAQVVHPRYAGTAKLIDPYISYTRSILESAMVSGGQEWKVI